MLVLPNKISPTLKNLPPKYIPLVRVFMYPGMFFLSIVFTYVVLSFINSATILEAQTAGDWSKIIVDQNMEGRTAIGDINGDGKNDVVVHKWGVTRGASQGAELSWYEYPNWNKHTIKTNTNFFGDGVVIADVDGDGKQDVVASKGTATIAEVWLYKNNGTTWEEVKIATVETDSETKDIEVHDMDGDAKKDIVVRTKHKTAVYYQTDYKTWTQAIRNTREREGMALGDMDGDGDYDIILNGFWLENTGNRNVSAWPEYTFDAKWYQDGAADGYMGNAATISIADMDKDGKNDIVICQAEKTGQPLNWYKSVNPKTGPNGWTKNTIDTVDYCHSMHARDFNNDGHVDVMMIEIARKSGASAYIYFDNGSGGFIETKLGTGGGYKASVGDIDNDNDIDIVTANAWASEGTVVGKPIYIWRNDGAGAMCEMTGWRRHVVDSNRPWRSVLIDAKDLNGDGKPDIVTGGWWYPNPGSADGTWIRTPIGEPLRNMGVLHDFDGDGAIDILGTKGGTTQNANPNSNELVWGRNNGSGSFTIYQNIPQTQGDFLQGAVAGNLQGNKVALSWHGLGGGVQLLTIPSNPMTTNWTLSKASTTSQDEELSIGDIDGDGNNDLLLGTKWLRNTGTGWSAHTISTKEPPDRNTLADINGDGRLDAVVGFESEPISAPADIYWYEAPENPITGTWTPHKVATIIGPMSLDVADMDGDGDMDIVSGEHNLASPATARAFVFENVDGKGTEWKQHLIYTGDEHHDGTKIVDIDGDGDKDVISIGWSNRNVVLYENVSTCTGQPQQPISSVSPTPPSGIAGCTGAFAGPTQPDPNPGPVEGYSKSLVPGSVYKEFSTVSNLNSSGTWRVTGSGAPSDGTVFRNRFGPHTENPVNYVEVNDLQGAVSAELMLSAWSGHPGSGEKKIRVNDQWFDLPLHPNVPAGKEADYYVQWNPVIQIPIEVLKNGRNELQGEVCARCTWWPQWGYMSSMIRVFYDPAQKPNVPSVQITSPVSNSTITDKQTIQTVAPGATEIDILGYYNGLDENGDGHFDDWHYEYITPRAVDSGVRNDRMYIKRHIGSGSQVVWDTLRVPNQAAGGIRLLARAKSPSGLWRVSERVDGLTLQRDFSIQMFRTNTLPTDFNSCRGTSDATITIPSQYLSQANRGILEVRSWAGTYADKILVNGQDVRGNYTLDSWKLRNYAYSETYHSIPEGVVQAQNSVEFERNACAGVHGSEILAPGPAMLLECGTPSVTTPSFIPPIYCGTDGLPQVGNRLPTGGEEIVVFPPYNEFAACTHIVGVGEQYPSVVAALQAIGSNGAGKVVCVRDNKEYIGITRINTSGEPGNPLVIKSHPDNTSKPKFIDPRPYSNSTDQRWQSPVDVWGNNVVLDGLESARSAGRGIRIAQAENVLLKDMEAHDSYDIAIAILGSKNVVVDGCYVYRDRYQGSPECRNNDNCKTPTVGEAIAAVDSENTLIQNCVVRDQLNRHGGGGTYASLRSKNTVIRNNEQYSEFVGPSLHPDNSIGVLYENNIIAAVCGHTGGASGFYQYDEVYPQQLSQNAYNTTVRNNLLVGMRAGLMLGGCEQQAGEFNSLPRIGPCKSIDQVVENNTVIASGTHGFMINMGRDSQDAGYTEVTGLRIANNIFYGAENSGIGGWANPGANPGDQFFSGNIWSKTPRFGLPSGDVVAPNLAGVFQGDINPESCVTEEQVKQFVTASRYGGKGADMRTIGNKNGLNYTITVGGTSAQQPVTQGNIGCSGGVVAGLSTQPCSVYREFKVLTTHGDNWRVTGPDATAEGAQDFLPNPIIDIPIDDLEYAMRAEVLLDVWGGHPGTQGKQIRINNNEWINVPLPRFELPPNNPSTSVNESDPMAYLYQNNPIIEIPLNQLREGNNTLEGTAARCGNGTCVSWPQWGINGIIVRVFYDPAMKSGPSGMITYPLPNTTIGEYPTIRVAAEAQAGVEEIDVIGNYYDYDENGDGFYRDWHRAYFVDKRPTTNPADFGITGHVGTTTSNPGGVLWDTTWVPDQQDDAISFIARIKDKDGYWSVSAPVGGITLSRQGASVQLFEPNKESIPPSFGVRVGQTKTSTVTLPGTFSYTTVSEAITHFRTWEGRLHGGDDPHGTYVLNDRYSGVIGGKNHHYAYTRPKINDLSVLVPGQNRISVSSNTIHHDNEILWPGPGLTVRYGGELLCPPLTPIPTIHLSPEPTEFPDVLTGIVLSPITRNDQQIFFTMGNPRRNGENGQSLSVEELRVYIDIGDGSIDQSLFEENMGNRVWVQGRVEEGENMSGEYERYAVTGPDDISMSKIKGKGMFGGAIEVDWSVIVPMSLVIFLIAGTGVVISRRF